MLKHLGIVPLLLLWLLSAQPLAAQLLAEHQLSFPNRQNQYVEVRLSLPVEGAEVDLVMPNWTPGSYVIEDFSAHVQDFHAHGAGGRPLAVKKVAKNRWRVNTAGEHAITVAYSVWAGALGVNSSWVERDYALLNGAGIFLFSESSRNWKQSVSVELPSDWSRAYSPLPAQDGGVHFLAADYDELVDSPMLLGNAPEYPFAVADRDYFLVNQGETALWNGAEAAQDVAAIVASVQKFWESDPFERPYWFFNVIAQGNGGLEHDYSTVLLAHPWQMKYREDYIRWLSLVTHEFFHAWNVRRLRPEALSFYDYENEAYTRELWLAEGLTSYYDSLLLLRSDLITVDEYFDLLAHEFHAFETTPGRQVSSAELASFDAWIKNYKPDANTVNSVVSYYRKGAVIGFLMDTAIRRKTGNRSSLDSLMRDMYRMYGPHGSSGTGYPPGAFEALTESVAGKEVRGQLEELLGTTRNPDIDAALAWYGLRMDRNPAKTAAQAAGQPAPAGFGLTWNKASPILEVETVIQGGAAAAAGILPADELLAIDNTRVNRETIEDRMIRLQPGETVNLLLVRHGRLLNLQLTVQDAIPQNFDILVKPDIDRQEKKRMASWLGLKLEFTSH